MKIEVSYSTAYAEYNNAEILSDDDKFIEIQIGTGAYAKLNWRYVIGYVEKEDDARFVAGAEIVDLDKP